MQIIALSITPGLLLAGYSVRKETRLGQAIAVVFLIAEIAFVLVQVIFNYKHGVHKFYRTIGIRMVAYAALALPLLGATVIVAGTCMWNFNKGLKQHLHAVRVTDIRQ